MLSYVFMRHSTFMRSKSTSMILFACRLLIMFFKIALLAPGVHGS
jgi:hypothetical protein